MQRVEFDGNENNRIVADLYSPKKTSKDAPVALLIHGGGQTRYSWAGAAKKLAQAGWHAIAMDQRGHGESDWVESGDYSFGRFGEDLRAIAAQIDQRFGVKPVVIGASLGGMASMIAEGEGGGGAVSAVVLVDVTPRMDPAGVAKVQGFMRARMEEGFASIEEAADAVAEYLPHRKRPPTTEGLKKNLRKHDDGRYRWHWDPRFMQRGAPSQADREGFVKRLSDAAANLKVPVLLVRGRESELVAEEHVRNFMELVPHARYADISGAGHMVAGDRNDIFAQAVIDFLHDYRRDPKALLSADAR